MNQSNATIAAAVGDTIEIRLPFGHKWGGPANTQGTLIMQQPAGYAVKSEKSCVWRFVATQSGKSNLSFTTQALCPHNAMCPMYIAVISYTIDVK
jgi:hypothetical protein